MEKILVFGCKNTMDDICIGCTRCMVGFNRKVGEFERYSERDAEPSTALTATRSSTR